MDATKLSGETIYPGYDAVVIRGTVTHWSPLACNDAGKLGDPSKGDKKYTCKLSAQIGKGKRFPHLGLPRPGRPRRNPRAPKSARRRSTPPDRPEVSPREVFPRSAASRLVTRSGPWRKSPPLVPSSWSRRLQSPGP